MSFSLASYTLGDIASQLDLKLVGDANAVIEGIAPIESAAAGDITFCAKNDFHTALKTSEALVVIVRPEDVDLVKHNALVHADPYLAFARVVGLLLPTPKPAPGIHATAVVDPSANIADTASIGPCAIVNAGVTIAADVVIEAHCVVGNDSQIGAGSWLHPNVTLYHGTVLGERVEIHSGTVIGADGFGYANENGKWLKIPQVGTVHIGNDVEIGANTTIDRGAMMPTQIGEGVKLDNQIQIAHNVKIGAHTAVAGCVGVAGSTTVGSHCTIGGGSGIAGHITISDNVHLTAMSGVRKSLTEPGVYSSSLEVTPAKAWYKNVTRLHQLDDIYKRLRKVEKHVKNNQSEEA